MADGSTIEWLNRPGTKPASWNPVRGCTRVSEGCVNCYAETMAARFSDPGMWGHGFAETVKKPGGGSVRRWTGKVELVEDRLTEPLRWRSPRTIFVNSTSDLFHERLPDEAIDRVFAVMALCPQHTFLVLTKRPERMRVYLAGMTGVRTYLAGKRWPLPNVWLGTSVEDQATADERIPHLLATPAAIRFASAEPLLGPIDFRLHQIGETRIDSLFGRVQTRQRYPDGGTGDYSVPEPYPARLDWIIVGGESGPGARPMHPDWARSIRDQCQAAGVPFFFKQWGAWAPHRAAGIYERARRLDYTDGTSLICVGKLAAGRLLDGWEWSDWPQ
jgi:protein gp37